MSNALMKDVKMIKLKRQTNIVERIKNHNIGDKNSLFLKTWP